MICPHCSGYIRDNRRGKALPERVVEALQAALPLARSRGANRPANPNQARFNVRHPWKVGRRWVALVGEVRVVARAGAR